MDNICEDCKQPYESHDGPCAASIRNKEDRERAIEIVSLLSKYVNQGRPEQLLVEIMSREHRTLQQRMTTVMLQWFVHLASLPMQFYDARNAKSVEVAKAIMPVLESQYVVVERRGEKEAHLPCI